MGSVPRNMMVGRRAGGLYGILVEAEPQLKGCLLEPATAHLMITVLNLQEKVRARIWQVAGRCWQGLGPFSPGEIKICTPCTGHARQPGSCRRCCCTWSESKASSADLELHGQLGSLIGSAKRCACFGVGWAWGMRAAPIMFLDPAISLCGGP
jgi:hypothetical protein